MEDRPRDTVLSLEGLAGGVIYTDEMDAAAAKPALRFTVPADTTMRLRIYAVVPGATRGRSLSRSISRRWPVREAPAQDRVNTEFSAPQAQ
jgi:hypothetical protein